MLLLLAALLQGAVATSLFDFEAVDIHGVNQRLSQYSGNVSIVINVASEWRYTDKMYPQLQQLYDKYRDQGFTVLAFPSNQFGAQEPGTNEEIFEFVQKYNVTFPMFSKINVNGRDAIPLYKWIKKQAKFFTIERIEWNFTKYLVDRNGKPITRYQPRIKPLEMEDHIVALLNADYT